MLRYVGVGSVVFEGVSDELVSGRVGSLIHTHISMRLPCATLAWSGSCGHHYSSMLSSEGFEDGALG